MTLTRTIKISPTQILRDRGTQSRLQIIEEVVGNYAEAFEKGEDFPPVEVFYDGENYILADGYHRLKAWIAVFGDEAPIVSHVRQGTERDAIKFSLSANAKHGLQRSQADKRQAVVRALADEEWGKLNNTEVAKLCEVSPTLVEKVREELNLGKLPVACPQEIIQRATRHASNPRSHRPKSSHVLTDVGAKYEIGTQPTDFQIYQGDDVDDGIQNGELVKVVSIHNSGKATIVRQGKVKQEEVSAFDLMPPEEIGIWCDPAIARMVGKVFDGKKYRNLNANPNPQRDCNCAFYHGRDARNFVVIMAWADAELIVVANDLFLATQRNFYKRSTAVCVGRELIFYFGGNLPEFKSQCLENDLGVVFK